MHRAVVADVDGVLASFSDPFRDLLASFGAVMLPFEDQDPRTWFWFELYGATKAHAESAWRYVAENPAWWGKLPRHRDFTDKLIDPLCELCSTENVYFISSRPAGTERATRQWLSFFLTQSDVNNASVLTVETPTVVITPKRKVSALVAIEPAAIIEDNLTTLQEYRAEIERLALPPCELILVDRAYNRGDREGITVVASTGEAIRKVQELQ